MCRQAVYRLAALTMLVTPVLLPATDLAQGDATGQLFPKPLKVQKGQGKFSLNEKTAVFVNPSTDEMKAIRQYLVDLFAPATGFKFATRPSGTSRANGILLEVDPSRHDLGDEGYTFGCTDVGIVILAAKPAGVFYGVQTLRQLLPEQVEDRRKVEGVAWTIPCVSIEDRPRFRWRGYLLDPARHFRTKEELKRYIDLLALQKMNVLQLHLSDDQGWRIEIKKYPKLVETGSRLPNYGGKKGEGWFYSQEDIRELVKYAADRYVTIVPEIEMPGHSGAAVASYPELGCGGKHPGGWSGPLCVSQETTLEHARNVLDEIIAVFPSPYIHVGADEVPAGPWRACPRCKAAMEKLAGRKLPDDVQPFRVKLTRPAGLPFHEDIGRLQGEFVRKIDQHLTSRGRRMVGWDEILDGGLQKESPALIMAWRSATAVVGAINQERDVVVSLYPDYYLDNNTPLARTYDFEPMPANLSVEEEKHVVGVQGNMWGEHTPTIQQVDYQTFPRLCALAEIGWTVREGRNFAEFSIRFAHFSKRLDMMKVNYKKTAGPTNK